VIESMVKVMERSPKRSTTSMRKPFAHTFSSS
jgi:hypothetical protein